MTDAVGRLRRKAQNEATCFALRDICNDQKKEIEAMHQKELEKNTEIMRLKSLLAQCKEALVEAFKLRAALCRNSDDNEPPKDPATWDLYLKRWTTVIAAIEKEGL